MSREWDDRRQERRERKERRRAQRDEWRQAWSTRTPFERPYNPHRLYRDRENRRIMGVCAGIANYFGIDPLPLRVAFIVGAFFFSFPVIPAYFVLGFLLPRRPPQLYASREEETLWREVTVAPDRNFYALKLKFRDLEARLGRMEADVTSEDFELRRKFRDIGA
jgi:phage shock protein C